MINPDTLVDSVVTALKSLPGLVTLVGSVTAINAYADDSSSLLDTIHRMASPSILVAWQNVDVSVPDGGTPWRHKIKIYVRVAPGQRFGAYMNAIINGVPVAPETRAPFSESDMINNSFVVIGVPLMARVSDDSGHDFLECEVIFEQKVDE